MYIYVCVAGGVGILYSDAPTRSHRGMLFGEYVSLGDICSRVWKTIWANVPLHPLMSLLNGSNPLWPPYHGTRPLESRCIEETM